MFYFCKKAKQKFSYSKISQRMPSRKTFLYQIYFWRFLSAQIPEISPFTAPNSYNYFEDMRSSGNYLQKKLVLGKSWKFLLNSDLSKRKCYVLCLAHTSQCSGLSLWTKETRLNHLQSCGYPRRGIYLAWSLVILYRIQVQLWPAAGSWDPAVWLLWHSHLCSALEGHWSTQSQKEILQFCLEGKHEVLASLTSDWINVKHCLAWIQDAPCPVMPS